MSPNKYAAESAIAQEARRRLHACEKKRAYKTEDEAKRKGFEIYKCEYCGLYHRTTDLDIKVKRLVHRLIRRKKPQRKDAKHES